MSIPTCAVRTVVLDSVGGQPLAGAIVSARLSTYEIYQGFVVPQDIEVTSAADGSVVLPLFPNELGSASSFYEVKIVAPNGKTLRTVAVVPNQANAELSEISEVPPYDGKPDAAVTIAQVQALKNQTLGLRDQAADSASSADADALATMGYRNDANNAKNSAALSAVDAGQKVLDAAQQVVLAAAERQAADAAAVLSGDRAGAAESAKAQAEVILTGVLSAADTVFVLDTYADAVAKHAAGLIPLDKGVSVVSDGNRNGLYANRAGVLTLVSDKTLNGVANSVKEIQYVGPMFGLWVYVEADVTGAIFFGRQTDGSEWEAQAGVMVMVGRETANADYIDGSGYRRTKKTAITEDVMLPATSGIPGTAPRFSNWRAADVDGVGNPYYVKKTDGLEYHAKDGTLSLIRSTVFPTRRPSFSRCIASNYPVVQNAENATYVQAVSFPGAYDAVRLIFPHAGGGGAVVGMTAAVAATDDLGDRTNVNVIGNGASRRFTTPWRAGVERNVYAADGWARVTVDGANTWGIEDSGDENLIFTKASDLIELHSIEDSLHPGWHSLLLRMYAGTGAFTRSGLTGFTDPTKFLAEAGHAYALGCFRGSGVAGPATGDMVSNLALLSNANNVTFGDACVLPVIYEVYQGGDRASTVMMIGDSRFAYPDAVTEMATYGYRTLSFRTEQRLLALKRKAVVTRCSQGARTTATYFARAQRYFQAGVTPDVVVYLCYSINDGIPTDALLASARTRVLRILELCKQAGSVPVLMSIFPDNNAAYAGVAPKVREFDRWVESLGTLFISPLRRYGDANCNWITGGGWNSDASHMSNPGYLDLGNLTGDVTAEVV